MLPLTSAPKHSHMSDCEGSPSESTPVVATTVMEFRNSNQQPWMNSDAMHISDRATPEPKRSFRRHSALLAGVILLSIGFLMMSYSSWAFPRIPPLLAVQLRATSIGKQLASLTNSDCKGEVAIETGAGTTRPGQKEADQLIPPAITPLPVSKLETVQDSLASSFVVPKGNLTHIPTILLCPRRHDVAYYASLHQRPVPPPGQRTFQNASSPAYARRDSIHSDTELSDEALAEAEQAEQYISETSGFDIDSVRTYRYYHMQQADWAAMELTSMPLFLNRHGVDVPQVFWNVWEVDIDVEKGEALIPFFVQTPRGSGNEGKYWQWDALHLQQQDELMESLKSLTQLRDADATPAMMQCRWTYGNDFNAEVHEITHPSLMSIQGQHRHMVCPFQAGVRPRRLQIVFNTTTLPHSSPLFSKVGHFEGTLDLPLCVTWQRRVVFSAMLRPAFGRISLKNVMDWVDYNVKIGFDAIYLPDREGNLLLRDDLDDQSVHAERLRTAISLGRVQYYLWPMRWAPKASYRMMDNEDQEATMFMLNERAKRATTWMLSADFDEYLHIPEMEIFDRQCDNSLFCDSPLLRWMRHKGFSGKGQLRFVPQAVVGQKVTELTVSQHPHRPEDMWRFAPVAHKTGFDFAAYAKADTSRVCPYEPQTEAAKRRVARFQEQQLSQPDSGHFVNTTYCEIPFAVKYLYTMPFVDMHEAHCKHLYRVDSMVGVSIHGNSVTRDEHVFDKPHEWARIHIRHYADINGRLEHESEAFVATNDYSPQSVARYFEGKERDTSVADIMMGTSLPPPTTADHAIQRIRLQKLPTMKMNQRIIRS